MGREGIMQKFGLYLLFVWAIKVKKRFMCLEEVYGICSSQAALDND